MTVPRELRPTPLEVAGGLPVGVTAPSAAPPPTAADDSPLEALERAVAPALESGRCVVSFSGGRDSSVVLAAAASAARRRSLPLPVPLTLRFPGLAESDEAAWQELVVAHLRLPDWERIECPGDEVDALGPNSRAVLRSHGVLWPPNASFHVPMFDRAKGGTLLSGAGGDVLFGSWRWGEAAALLRGRRRPRPRDPLALALMAAPVALRRRVDARRSPSAPDWLTPAAARDYSAAFAAQRSSQPRSWRAYPGWAARVRMVALGASAQAAVAAGRGCSALDPLLDPGFLRALARAGGSLGPGSRTDTMRRFFGSLVPDDVLARTTKAVFNQAIWGEPTREFARRWDGTGLDTALVDAGALRAAWARGPDIRGLMPLQAAWLGSDTEGA